MVNFRKFARELAPIDYPPMPLPNNLRPELESLSIVVVGNFNPAIFHPSWFLRTQLFSETDIEESLKDFKGIVHRDMTQYGIAWCNFIIQPNRIIISTKMDAYFVRLRDLLFATFKELIHTPVIAVGINPEGEFKAPSFERWDNFGHKIVPKDDWKEIATDPRLKELTIEDKPRRDKFKGWTLIRIRPSEIIEIPNGINIHMNDHHMFENSRPEDGAKPLLEVLEDGFENTMKRWEKTHQHLTSLI